MSMHVKKTEKILASSVLALSMMAGCGRKEEKMDEVEDVRIIVASDLHYLSPALSDNGEFFQRMMSKADGKVTEYCEPLVDAFIEQVIDEKPDAVVLSGDLSFNGARQSLEDLSGKLEKIKDSGIRVYVIPGNHDIETGLAYSFEGDDAIPVEDCSADQFAMYFQDFGYGEALSRDPASLSYTADVNDTLRLLMVDVNTVDDPGEVKDSTVKWVEKQLRKAQKDGVHVLAVSHQNVERQFPSFWFGFTMGNNEALLKLYEKYHVICSLSGHIHMQHIQKSENGFVEIASSSLSVSPDQYGVVEISGHTMNYHTEPVDVAKYESGEYPELSGFAEYSRRYFMQVAEQKEKERLEGKENAEEVAEWNAEVMADFFAGRMDLAPVDDASLEKARNADSSLTEFLETLSEEDFQNQNEITIPFD